MKICKTCLVPKEDKEFPWYSKKKGTQSAHCIPCYAKIRKKKRLNNLDKRREENRKSYERNKDKRKQEVLRYQKENKDKVAGWQKKQRIKRKKEFFDWKATLKCSNCPENHIACLEFHHVDPSTKEGLISKLKDSPIRLKKELKKCIVLCSNCHRKLHYNEKIKQNV